MSIKITVIAALLTLALMIGICIARAQVHCRPCPPVVFLPVIFNTEARE